MFNDKKSPFIPDLSRFFAGDGSHGGVWDTSNICLAHYRFNEYAGPEDARFIDRSGRQEGITVVTGSASSNTIGPTSPVALNYDPLMYTDSSGNPITVHSAELIPGTDKRIIQPYQKRVFDFAARQRKFLLQRNLKGVDPTTTDGCTFVFRYYLSSLARPANEQELIFSISELGTTQIAFSAQGLGSSDYDIWFRTFAEGSSNNALARYLSYDTWYTIIGYVKQGASKIEVWSHADGSLTDDDTDSWSDTNDSLDDPKIFIGYGDYNSSPSSSFSDATDWGKYSRIGELAIFDGWITQAMAQAIATGWSDNAPDSSTSHDSLFNRYVSGLDSRGPKTVLKKMDNAVRTYPSIARSGEQDRLGNSVTRPFDDTGTLIYTSSVVMYPDMLPSSLYAETGVDPLHPRNGPFVKPYHKFPPGVDQSQKRIVVTASLRPGLANEEVFIMNRVEGYGNFMDSWDVSSGLSNAISPFNESRVDTSYERLSTVATPSDTLLGFDQKLGDRIAIVIDLPNAADTTMGHITFGLLDQTTANDGISTRTGAGICPKPGSDNTINSICYYNFGKGRWDVSGVIPANIDVAASAMINTCSIAFAGTTGFVISPDEKEPLLPLKSRGRPTDYFGFPFDERWQAKSEGQLLDMSKYISSPFLLEKLEIVQDMVFYESGDDGLGYVIRDPDKSPNTMLSVSSSHGSTARAQGLSVIPDYARCTRDDVNIYTGSFLDASTTTLVGRWKMISNINLVAELDYSSQGNDSTTGYVGAPVQVSETPDNYSNVATYSQEWIEDGSSYIDIGTATIWNNLIGTGGTQQMTFACWVYVDGTEGNNGDYPRVFNVGEYSAGQILIYIGDTHAAGENRIYFMTNWLHSVTAVDIVGEWYSDTKVPHQTWTHIAVKYNAVNGAGRTPYFYINGVAVGAVTVRQPNVEEPPAVGVPTWQGITTNELTIGNRKGRDRPWIGKISDFAIWNVLLSDLQIARKINRTSLTSNFMVSDTYHDTFSYGRFPLIGGMRGQQGGDRLVDMDPNPNGYSALSKGFLLASDDGEYKVVRNAFHYKEVANQADQRIYSSSSSLFRNAHTETMPISSSLSQTYGGSPFWRCDTFFLMRQATGTISKSVVKTPPDAMIQDPSRSHQWPNELTAGDPTAWQPLLPESYDVDNTSTGSIRELITYSQIAHYGYARSSAECQAFKSGSAWQEINFLRAGARGGSVPGSDLSAIFYKAELSGDTLSVRSGYPHDADSVWMYRTDDADADKGSRHPGDSRWTDLEQLPGSQFEFISARYPAQTFVNVLGLDCYKYSQADDDGPAAYSIFEKQWFSGSVETGGGSFVSNPTHFVPELDVLGPGDANNESRHGAQDFFQFGGFFLTGSETKQNFLNAGLSRDLSINLVTGSRFIKLYAADPTPGALGWADIGDVTGSVGDIPDWALYQPTSAYLVATASREWIADSDSWQLAGTRAVLNQGRFSILADIKNSSAGGVAAGATWLSRYDQYTSEFSGGTAATPVIPQDSATSESHDFFPRRGNYLHQISELTSINPVYRSIGLSSGRSFVKAVPATNMTSQSLSFAPPSREISAGIGAAGQINDWSPRLFEGYYGWTGVVGAATFTQKEKWTPASTSSFFSGSYPDAGGTYINQTLPYALGHDTAPWTTILPNLLSSTGSQSFSFTNAGLVVPGHIPQMEANWPFTLPVMQKTDGVLAREYEENSPYILMPNDKLILGFQPALGGMNEGAPKPFNVSSGPFTVADETGHQGIGNNDAGAQGNPIAYGYAGVEFQSGVNRSILSEQIRQTILQAGTGKLVLYGTLLRDNKPHSSELNQPLVTNAIHEALHSDNPVLDQFMVDDKTAYSGSYLDHYVTGSQRLSLSQKPNPMRRVSSTGQAGTFSYDFAFERFVTIADSNEVYWDSILPNPFDIWKADGKLVPAVGTKLPKSVVFYMSDYFNVNTGQLGPAETSPVTFTPADVVNVSWINAFPFEARYDDVGRLLEDPGDQSRRPGYYQGDSLWYQTMTNTDPMHYVKYTWLRDPRTREFGTVSLGTDIGPSGSAPGSKLYSPVGVKQSQNTGDKAFAAALYGFCSTGGKYGLPWTHSGNQSNYPPVRKVLNVAEYGTGITSSPWIIFDHPEGVKYGLKNYVWYHSTSVFRPDKYGQFRDRLEQRRYTKFYHKGDEDTPRGTQEAAVSCIFVDADGNPVDDAHKTSCQNVSTFMTSSLPYFEGEAQRTPITNPYVSIDIGNMVSRTTLR